MTELLRHIISNSEKLPGQKKDAIATWLLAELEVLAELEAKQTWKTRFASTLQL